MKNRKNTIASIALCALFSFATFTTPVYGADTITGANHELYTISGFIDLLISKGIISEAKATQARELAKFAEKIDEAKTDIAPSTDDVEVTVSQYIEYGDLTYSTFEDIKGLLLTVKNTSDTAKTLEAKRSCQVVYRIYDDKDVLLYDATDEKACQTTEQVTYVLEAGKTRIFPIIHNMDKYSLRTGLYRFEIEYPEYGKGERMITVK
jgi:hypothetical protein